MSEQKITLKISESDPDVAYLRLPDHPGPGTSNVVKKQICLNELIQKYKGPDGTLIGIEMLG